MRRHDRSRCVYGYRSLRYGLVVLPGLLLSGCMSAQSLQSIGGEGVTLFSASQENTGGAGQLDRRLMQERRLSAPKPLVFAGVISVLADSGFRATSADVNTGFITAIGGSKNRVALNVGGLSRISDLPTVSVFVEDNADGITSVRAVFGISTYSSGASGAIPERILEDETIYTRFFDRLALEINERSIGNVAKIERKEAPESDRLESQAVPLLETPPSPFDEPVARHVAFPPD